MKGMKKEYVTPEVEITEFQEEVILMSGFGDNDIDEGEQGWWG